MNAPCHPQDSQHSGSMLFDLGENVGYAVFEVEKRTPVLFAHWPGLLLLIHDLFQD